MNFLSVMKGKQWRIALALAGMLGMSMMCCRAIAQETATEEAATEEAAAAPAETPAAPTLEEVNAKADAAALAGHNAWMLTSSALVLFMTAPGLAMFYGGLVRKKNVLSVMMQCLFLMAHDDGDLGLVRLLAGVRRSRLHRTQAVHRRRRLSVHEGRRPQLAGGRHRAGRADFTRRRDSTAHAHAVPRHVLHHHAGADLRCLCRTDEVQRDGAVPASCGARSFTARSATGCGAAACWPMCPSRA